MRQAGQSSVVYRQYVGNLEFVQMTSRWNDFRQSCTAIQRRAHLPPIYLWITMKEVVQYQGEAMTTTATAATPPDIQWEGYDGSEINGTIVHSKSSSCDVPVVEQVNRDTTTTTTTNSDSADKTILDVEVSRDKLEDSNDILVEDSEINIASSLKRKASDSLTDDNVVTSIPVDADVSAEELLEQVRDTVPTDSTQVPVTTEESNKRARRAVPSRISWEERLAALIAYKEEHGHLQIPIRYKKNPSLGKFVHNTREQYKLFRNQCKLGYQKRCSLTEERINELNNIGFIWTTERVKKQSDDWNARLEQLKEYKAKHGVRASNFKSKMCHNSSNLFESLPCSVLGLLGAAWI